jgi:hypothetical protein
MSLIQTKLFMLVLMSYLGSLLASYFSPYSPNFSCTIPSLSLVSLDVGPFPACGVDVDGPPSPASPGAVGGVCVRLTFSPFV